mmetsp:Transcript_121943/g.242875  ORF Transcript_121943/g.242875 Transcript_121943/m.242875 type:complete len:211 (+) Transcript_121943:1136-1768(+)
MTRRPQGAVHCSPFLLRKRSLKPTRTCGISKPARGTSSTQREALLQRQLWCLPVLGNAVRTKWLELRPTGGFSLRRATCLRRSANSDIDGVLRNPKLLAGRTRMSGTHCRSQVARSTPKWVASPATQEVAVKLVWVADPCAFADWGWRWQLEQMGCFSHSWHGQGIHQSAASHHCRGIRCDTDLQHQIWPGRCCLQLTFQTTTCSLHRVR